MNGSPPGDVRTVSLASGVGRIAIGIGMLVAPKTSLGLMGFPGANQATVTIARVAGIRDVVMGVATLRSVGDRDRLRAANLANAAADGGDSAAFAIALRQGEKAAGLRGVSVAAPATLAGLWAAWRLS